MSASTKKSINFSVDINIIIEQLRHIKSDDYSKIPDNSQNHETLDPLVNKLNEIAYALQVQAQALAQKEKEIEDKNNLMEAILENIPTIFFLKNAQDNFKVTYWNKAAEDILEVPRSVVLGKTAYDLWPKEQADLFQAADLRVCSGNNEIDIQIEPIETKSRGTIWLQTKKVPLRLGNKNQVSHLLAISSDITESKKNEENIKNLNHQLQVIVDNIPGCISRCDLNGTYTLVNKTYETWYGMSKDQMIGKTQRDVLPPKIYEQAEPNIKRAQKGEEFSFEGQVLTKSDEKLDVLVTHISDYDIAGKFSGYFNFIFNVTHVKQAEHLLHQEKIKLERLVAGINASAILALTDRAGKITFVNDLFCLISGYSRDELIGQTHRIINSGVHSFQFFKDMWKTILNGEVWHDEVCNRKKDGTLYWVDSTITNIVDSDGNTQFMAIRFDITHQKEAQIKIKELAQQLQDAQSISKIGSWEIDIKTNHLFWSQELYKIFEIDESQTQKDLYKLFRKRIHPEELGKLDQIVDKSQMNSENFISEYRLVFDNNRIKNVQNIRKVIKDDAGNIIKVFGTCQDITERVLLEKELDSERTKALHSAKLASLGEMSAGIAHEINNPLAIISGNVMLLEKYKNDPEKFTLKLAAMKRSTERIAKIILGLKKFARLNNESDRKIMNLVDIVQEAIILTDGKSKRHAILIETSFQTNSKIYCDEIEIEQVIVNLINNAIDAIKELIEKWVKIYIFKNEVEVIFQIKDSGPGISPEIEDKMFQPFFTTKPVGQGTGLGLSIIKGILDEHNASISLNREDNNTCFEIRFPIVKETANAI